MDAERLVTVSRNTLAQSRVVRDVVAEAWQAQALAQAIGARLAVYGPPELRGEARGLCETGARGVGALDQPEVRSGGIRAAQLTGVADVRAALTGLAGLLVDVGIALVGVACATEEDAMYWQCIEAVDAADESTDRVAGMLRILADLDLGRPPDTSRGRAGPSAGAGWTAAEWPGSSEPASPDRSSALSDRSDRSDRLDVSWSAGVSGHEAQRAEPAGRPSAVGPVGAGGPAGNCCPGNRGGTPSARGPLGSGAGRCGVPGTVNSAAGSW